MDAELGRDLAPGTAKAPWKSVWRVARARLSPGDRVLFKRGQTFRGQMRLECVGTAQNPIVFSSYGEGPPPSLRGSALRSEKSDWIAGSGVWYLAGLHRDPVNVLADGQPGRRVARREDLRNEWDHFYDPHLGRLLLKAENNPALSARTVEVGENDYVLGPVSGSHLVFEGLSFAQPRTSRITSYNVCYTKLCIHYTKLYEAGKLDAVMGSVALRHRLGDEARKIVDRFSERRVMALWEALIVITSYSIHDTK